VTGRHRRWVLTPRAAEPVARPLNMRRDIPVAPVPAVVVEVPASAAGFVTACTT
jgi:hypothetical protein